MLVTLGDPLLDLECIRTDIALGRPVDPRALLELVDDAATSIVGKMEDLEEELKEKTEEYDELEKRCNKHHKQRTKTLKKVDEKLCELRAEAGRTLPEWLEDKVEKIRILLAEMPTDDTEDY